MKLVVGLGNPGPKYEGTRHNIGFEVLFKLAERHFGSTWSRKFEGQVYETNFGPERVLMLAPGTYMNLSGRSVKAAVQFYKLFPAEVLVICDDLNLPAAKLRLRSGGSSGGQKGLQNIVDQLGTQEVPRLRIGVGRPPDTVDAANYVLQRFSKSEQSQVQEAISLAAQAVECWAGEGILKAMNLFNQNA